MRCIYNDNNNGHQMDLTPLNIDMQSIKIIKCTKAQRYAFQHQQTHESTPPSSRTVSYVKSNHHACVDLFSSQKTPARVITS